MALEQRTSRIAKASLLELSATPSHTDTINSVRYIDSAKLRFTDFLPGGYNRYLDRNNYDSLDQIPRWDEKGKQIIYPKGYQPIFQKELLRFWHPAAFIVEIAAISIAAYYASKLF